MILKSTKLVLRTNLISALNLFAAFKTGNALALRTHTLGRKSYRRVYDEMVKENPKEKVTRTMVWKAGHINKKSEQVLPSAAKAYALVEEEEEKQKLECSGNEEANTYDLNNDPISKVFGSDRKKNYCRAISSTSSTKQVKLMQASKAITDKNKKEDFRQWSSELQNQMANHVANQVANQVSSQINKALKSFASSFLTMIPGLQHNLNNGNVTPMTETASNLNKSPSNIGVASIPSNEVGSSTRGKQFVMLLSQDVKKDVAKAYIGTQTMCHFREIVPNIEKVVWVTEVLEPEAPIYDGPQNGHYKLCELLDGGLVIWPVFRLRSI